MAHFAKNLGDKQIDFYSAGQNKVCAQKTTGAIDKRMQAPKEIIHNKYLQHLTTAHRTCSTAAAVVGHDHGQLLASNHSRNNQHSPILQLFFLLFDNFA